MDTDNVTLSGRGLKEAIVREEAEFMIDGSQAGGGSPEVTFPGKGINVLVIYIGNRQYRCSYTPVIPGNYLLDVTWDGRQLRGSPYKIAVSDPERVIVSGEGLHGGILGTDVNMLIDTRNAGPGWLTAQCMGPCQNAHCEFEDRGNGTFPLRIVPQESGRHVLHVKYGDVHVKGSPFLLKVKAKSDASKVRVVGPGIEHGILDVFQSRFVVETQGAGPGELTVTLRGPRGGFRIEMLRDRYKDRTILCRYDPTECGMYIISAKWSGVDVPGSPFHVHIVENQKELDKLLNESSRRTSTFHTNLSDQDIYKTQGALEKIDMQHEHKIETRLTNISIEDSGDSKRSTTSSSSRLSDSVRMSSDEDKSQSEDTSSSFQPSDSLRISSDDGDSPNANIGTRSFGLQVSIGQSAMSEALSSEGDGDIVIVKQVPCETCQKMATAQVNTSSWYCQDCRDYLCTQCKRYHEVSRASTHHKMVNLLPSCDLCDNGDGVAEWYCTNCAEFLCQACRDYHRKLTKSKFHQVVSSILEIRNRTK